MNLAQVDFQQLRIKHILYKSKVRSMLYGGAFDEAFFSRNGPIGVWFATIGMVRYMNESEMGEMAKVHQELEAITLDLYRLYRNGKIDEAHDGLKNVEKHSERFLALLFLLEGTVKRSLEQTPIAQTGGGGCKPTYLQAFAQLSTLVESFIK